MVVGAKAIVPKTLDYRRITKEVEKELDSIARGVERDWNDFVAPFDPPAEIVKRRLRARGTYGWEVGTDDKRVMYLDEGTKPHTIRAKPGRTLRFKRNYKRKTRKGRIKSSSGGSSGETQYAKEVHHPGTEPLHITETIAEKTEKPLKNRVDRAIRRGSKRQFR
jgi:hypothetical protein